MKAIPALVLNERADAASHTLPPLLVEAERIAATIMQGIHGRKRSGPGESFWQYRAYGFGDSTSRIDWRKSARSSHVFIRENEWEAANTLWLWASPLKSMDLQYGRHLSDIQALPIADGLKDVLINQGFTIRRILQTKPNDLAAMLGIEEYVAKIILNAAERHL